MKWNGSYCQKKYPRRKGKYDKLLSPQFLIVGNTFNVEKHETDNKSPEWATAKDFTKTDRIINIKLHQNQVVKIKRNDNIARLIECPRSSTKLNIF